MAGRRVDGLAADAGRGGLAEISHAKSNKKVRGGKDSARSSAVLEQ